MEDSPSRRSSYKSAGVDTEAAVANLGGLLRWVKESLQYREGAGEPLLPMGFFASVLKLTNRLSLAVSTDGVGSKTVVAQMAGSYESIGVDCVAVNVNDVLCTGAEPVALLDYIACQAPHADMLEQLGKGLQEGARQARVGIVGGELSQHPDTLTGPRPGYAFDIAGTALGILDGYAPITGSNIRPGDVVLGMPSNGIHSNGLTLARRVLLGKDGQGIDRYLAECGRTVGEELLRPTAIYVAEVMALLRDGIDVRGLAHISGDGLLNLARLDANVGYAITHLPPVPPIFDIIQAEGELDAAEMFRVFNMGVGFCVVVGQQDVDAALSASAGAGGAAQVIGRVVAWPKRRVLIEQFGLVGEGGRFVEGRSGGPASG